METWLLTLELNVTLIFSIISTKISSLFLPPGSFATTDLVTAVPGIRLVPCCMKSKLLELIKSYVQVDYQVNNILENVIDQTTTYHKNSSRAQWLQACSINHNWLIKYIGLQHFSRRCLHITKILVEKDNSRYFEDTN